MELKITKREQEKKKDAKRLRKQGQIPAVIYEGAESSELISVDLASFEKVLRSIPKGHLPTTVVELTDDSGKKKAVVKGIEYNPTTYQVLHLDFVVLKPEVEIKVKVPIEYTGAAECVGVKQGGVLRKPIRHVTISCLPKDLPKQFDFDVMMLEMNQHAKLDQLQIPEGVKMLSPLDMVIAVVAKR